MEKKPEVVETTDKNPYCPQGWTKLDLQEASRQFKAIHETKAYEWIGHYLGVQQRHYEGNMAPRNPESLAHGSYIALGSRVNEINEVWGAFKVLTGLEDEIRKDDKNGEKA